MSLSNNKHKYMQIESRSGGKPSSRKKFKRKGFPQKSRSEFCGKRSSEHQSKAARNEAACEICSAATRRRETLLGSVILEAKAAFIPLPPSVREVPRRGGRSHLILGAFLRGEQVLSCLSGLPQKSRGEFCGKRSGRRIRSCGKRSAPQTKTPCRDEVGSLPLANLEMPHCSGHFLTEAAFPLRRRDGGLPKVSSI